MSTNPLSIIRHMGDDAPLLTKTDMWLETKRHMLSQRFAELCDELRTVQLAQRIKRQLQQTNHVAVRCSEEADEIIRIMSLPDALEVLEEEPDRNRKQMNHWALDGYDIETAADMR